MVDSFSDFKRKISFSSSDEYSPSTSHLHKKQRDLSNMNSDDGSNNGCGSRADPPSSIPSAPYPQTFPAQAAGPYPQPYQFMPGFSMVSGIPGTGIPNASSTPTYPAYPPPGPIQSPTLPVIPDISDTALSKIVNAVRSTMMQEFKMYVDARVDPLCRAYDDLCEKNKELTKRIDELEMYSRKNCVRIFGVPESEGKDDTDKVVLDLCEKLNIPLQQTDLVVSHRVGPTDTGKPRPIIARITNYNLRHRLLKESKTKKLHKMEGSKGVWVNQDLTRTRAKVAAEARKLVNINRAKASFNWDGKIFVIDNFDHKHQVATMDELISLSGKLGPPRKPPSDPMNANNDGPDSDRTE